KNPKIMGGGEARRYILGFYILCKSLRELKGKNDPYKTKKNRGGRSSPLFFLRSIILCKSFKT
ncbi:hypothetical protein, partial [Pseudanabaena sp. UWO311]|uniref:hypothetical protein n=1 Tax=Pseudanabaena sp. UWO311 TaxID=2487337 RepID=UPI001CC1E678